MKKKIKQIAKIILSKKLNEIQYFENKLATNTAIKSFKKIDDLYYEVELISNDKVVIRNQKHSDFSVFRQIFNEKEYGLVLKTFLLNDNFKGKKIIIDAGANVGYTSSYFSINLDDVQIFAVEPSEKNAQVFALNVSFLKNKDKVLLYQNALSDKENQFFETETNFRDGKDWSITTKEVENGTLKGITIDEIIRENNLSYISLLKIDIEGAERFIFTKENNLSFLDKTQIIAIEIHDEFNIRQTIHSILKEHQFFLFESGELTIGINKSML